jgi:hypothetical protein
MNLLSRIYEVKSHENEDDVDDGGKGSGKRIPPVKDALWSCVPSDMSIDKVIERIAAL